MTATVPLVPIRDMIERLCDQLDMPLRERNSLHLAAGFAPAHAERALTDLGAARQAVEGVLRLEPNPAVAVNCAGIWSRPTQPLTSFSPRPGATPSTADPGLDELLAELLRYPAPVGDDHPVRQSADDLVVPLQLSTEYGDLALLYTTTVFGSPRDLTLDEIAIETFFPADDQTARLLRAVVPTAGG